MDANTEADDQTNIISPGFGDNKSGCLPVSDSATILDLSSALES